MGIAVVPFKPLCILCTYNSSWKLLWKVKTLNFRKTPQYDDQSGARICTIDQAMRSKCFWLVQPFWSLQKRHPVSLIVLTGSDLVNRPTRVHMNVQSLFFHYFYKQHLKNQLNKSHNHFIPHQHATFCVIFHIYSVHIPFVHTSTKHLPCETR